ncbi:hypothetical protein AC519_0139 [Pseudomonas savastanoi]|nr:hypothetical protein AC519_0139 [Pseudomonas savastanoi]
MVQQKLCQLSFSVEKIAVSRWACWASALYLTSHRLRGF